jgi:hypothetical protein
MVAELGWWSFRGLWSERLAMLDTRRATALVESRRPVPATSAPGDECGRVGQLVVAPRLSGAELLQLLGEIPAAYAADGG